MVRYSDLLISLMDESKPELNQPPTKQTTTCMRGIE